MNTQEPAVLARPRLQSAANLRLGLPAPGQRSVCDALDNLLDTGVVVRGEITLNVADVELVYLSVELVLCSTETAKKLRAENKLPAVPETN
ncbi:MAG: gas vesicle protein [Verrucomicrobia bacterium]|nr:gas vesicle protein [Verrucomicrobiota bacterium]